MFRYGLFVVLACAVFSAPTLAQVPTPEPDVLFSTDDLVLDQPLWTLRIHPQRRTLDVFAPEGRMIRRINSGALRREVSWGGVGLAFSYGKDAQGNMTVLVRNPFNATVRVQLEAYEPIVTVPSGASFTIETNLGYRHVRFIPSEGKRPLIGEESMKQAVQVVHEPDPTPLPKPIAEPAEQEEEPASMLAEVPEPEEEMTEPAELLEDIPADEPSEQERAELEQAKTIDTEKMAFENLRQQREFSLALHRALLETRKSMASFLDRLAKTAHGAWAEGEPLELPTWLGDNFREGTVVVREQVRELTRANEELQEQMGVLNQELRLAVRGVEDKDFTMSAEVPADMKEFAVEANRLFEEGRLDQSATAYQRILESYPKCLHALSNLAVVRYTQGDFAEAQQLLRRALDNFAFDSFSRSILGVTLYKDGKHDQAFEELLLAYAVAPEDAQTLNYLALTCTDRGWLENATQLLQRAIQLNPNYSEAHHNLAVVYASQEPPARELARQHYEQAVALGGAKSPELEKLIYVDPQQ